MANGRGIVFMGFKECLWCQQYAVFLHDVAREMEIDRIYSWRGFNTHCPLRTCLRVQPWGVLKGIKPETNTF